jgi:hypothetical protein
MTLAGTATLLTTLAQSRQGRTYDTAACRRLRAWLRMRAHDAGGLRLNEQEPRIESRGCHVSSWRYWRD